MLRRAVRGDVEKMHKEELHAVCPSPNNIRVIQARRMRYTGHVAREGT
jgi:hypothetical protein